MWIFAYGSIIFRPSFPFIDRRRAFVADFARRFWQGSPDHRGVPEAPGRVVTLVPMRGEMCGGAAYRISPENAETTLRELDEREKAGFERRHIPLLDRPGGEAFAEGVTYVAIESNVHFLGDAPYEAIAAHIAQSHGPSGPNAEYALRLRDALRALEVHDPHVETTVSCLLDVLEA
jgi:glutathione-specific gamma-glutamylcyclotransferase